MTFHQAAVIGTGMMGPGIAATLARGGLTVTMLSRSREGAAAGVAKAREAAGPEFAGAIDGSTDMERVVAGVDLVVESAPEEMAFKQKLFAYLDGVAHPDAAICSNTSGLSITEISSLCRHPERILTTHFWNPPALMPLVEVVCGEATSVDVAASVRELLMRCGKVAVMVKKDRPGQLGNRLQSAVFREALHIVQEGIADAEQVDLAIKTGFGLRLPVYGSFEHMDMVGLDLVKAVLSNALTDLNSSRETPRILLDKIAAGELGVKSGKGFYDWSKRNPARVRALRDRFLREFNGSEVAREAVE
jgi:3-hydroxybutyryl-CoA dehydrogenase